MPHRLRNTLVHRGINYAMEAAPFLSCPEAQPFVVRLAANEQGPLAICAWEISGNRLVLSYGEFWLEGDGEGPRCALMKEIFGQRHSLPATWYSGSFRVVPMNRQGDSLELSFTDGVLVAELVCPPETAAG